MRRARRYAVCMTVKEEVHALIEELAHDSPWLREIRESLRMSKAIDEAEEDIRHGRVYSEEEFMAKVRERWPCSLESIWRTARANRNRHSAGAVLTSIP
jgi:hypothetical protein